MSLYSAKHRYQPKLNNKVYSAYVVQGYIFVGGNLTYGNIVYCVFLISIKALGKSVKIYRFKTCGVVRFALKLCRFVFTTNQSIFVFVS